MLPNAVLVMLKMKELNLSKRDVAIKMGYKNLDKGMRKIHQFMNEGYYKKAFSDNLLRCFAVDSLALEVIKTATNQVLELEKRIVGLERQIEYSKSFTPFVYKKNNFPPPKGFFSAMGFHGMTRRRLNKKILDLSVDEQLTKISKMIIDDFLDDDDEHIISNKITGYYYRKDWDTSYEFNTEGKLVNREIKGLEMF